MLKKYYPDMYAENVYQIDYETLWLEGYRALIFDIDNTLVHHGDDSNDKVNNLFDKLKTIGFKLLLLSDNTKERVERFNKDIQAMYICDAEKPSPRNYYNAVDMLGIDKKQILVIGDQVFTDIYGANRAGLTNCLVHFIRLNSEKKIGRKRYIENVILFFAKIRMKKEKMLIQNNGNTAIKIKTKQPINTQRKLFCEINPVTYKISEYGNIVRRKLKDAIRGKKFAKTHETQKLPVLLSSTSCNLIKRAPGIDLSSQYNKAGNIDRACKTLNGLVIKPGEEFSFWNTVGATTKAKGYKDGRVIIKGKLISGVGGGLCNLGNSLHLIVIETPVEVTEVHFHSDALAPDPNGIRTPMSAGTSVSYNYIDFRFKNTTDQQLQIMAWVADEKLFMEFRGEKELDCIYRLSEENHHFHKEGDKYYRVSKIYQDTVDKSSGEVMSRRLVRNNHSEVMFDCNLIPPEQIR